MNKYLVCVCELGKSILNGLVQRMAVFLIFAFIFIFIFKFFFWLIGGVEFISVLTRTRHR